VWFSQWLLLQLKTYTVNCVIQPVATATVKELYSELCDSAFGWQHWLSSKWSNCSWVCHDTATCLEVLYVDSFLNIFSRLLKENTATVATEIQTSLLGNLIQQRPTEEAKTWWRSATEARVCCSLPLGTNGLNKTEQVIVSFPVSHCISQDMTRYFLLSHSCYLLEDKRVRKCNQEWKRGQGFAWANGNSATVHIPDIMPFSHLQVAEAVFVFLNSHQHTEQHLYCLLPSAAPTGPIPSTSLYKWHMSLHPTFHMHLNQFSHPDHGRGIIALKY
jgi:hypothetical protein